MFLLLELLVAFDCCRRCLVLFVIPVLCALVVGYFTEVDLLGLFAIPSGICFTCVFCLDSSLFVGVLLCWWLFFFVTLSFWLPCYTLHLVFPLRLIVRLSVWFDIGCLR